MLRPVVFLLAAALLTTSLELRAQSYDDVEEEEATDKERAAKEKADKQKADKQKAAKEKADKEKAAKEKAAKEKAAKEKADKLKADRAATDGIEVSEEPIDQEAGSVKAEEPTRAKAETQKTQKKKQAKKKQKAKKPKSLPAPVANKTAKKTKDAVPGTATPSSMPRLLGLSLPVWLCGGGAVLFGVAAGVTGGLAVAKNSEYQDVNNGLNPTAADELRSTGQTLNIATDVLLGATALSAGAGVALFFLDGGPDRFMTGTLVPAVTPNGASLHWYSQF